MFRFPESGNPATIRGEAVVVVLGERGKVFALLPDQSWKNGIYQAFPVKEASSLEGILYHKNLKVGQEAEWKTWRPRLVMFEDVNKPASVILLMSGDYYDYDTKSLEADSFFSETLGTNYELKRILAEITEQPLTKSLGETLGWLSKHYNKMLDGRKYNTINASNKLANSMSSGSFSTEGKKNEK